MNNQTTRLVLYSGTGRATEEGGEVLAEAEITHTDTTYFFRGELVPEWEIRRRIDAAVVGAKPLEGGLTRGQAFINEVFKAKTELLKRKVQLVSTTTL